MDIINRSLMANRVELAINRNPLWNGAQLSQIGEVKTKSYFGQVFFSLPYTNASTWDTVEKKKHAINQEIDGFSSISAQTSFSKADKFQFIWQP